MWKRFQHSVLILRAKEQFGWFFINPQKSISNHRKEWVTNAGSMWEVLKPASLTATRQRTKFSNGILHLRKKKPSGFHPEIFQGFLRKNILGFLKDFSSFFFYLRIPSGNTRAVHSEFLQEFQVWSRIKSRIPPGGSSGISRRFFFRRLTKNCF